LNDRTESHAESSERVQHSDITDTNETNDIPIPITRVERVDDEPSHGEVPGTEAYDMRTADAEPDQFAVIPESPELLDRSQPANGDEAVGAESASGEHIGTFYVTKALNSRERLTKSGSPTSNEIRFDSAKVEASPPAHHEAANEDDALTEHDLGTNDLNGEQHDDEDEEETLGDDFDNFEEGEEADDFGDFDAQSEVPFTEQPKNITPTSEDAIPQSNFIPQRVSYPTCLLSRRST